MKGTIEIKRHTYEEEKELFKLYNEATKKSYEEWLKKQNKGIDN